MLDIFETDQEQRGGIFMNGRMAGKTEISRYLRARNVTPGRDAELIKTKNGGPIDFSMLQMDKERKW